MRIMRIIANRSCVPTSASNCGTAPPVHQRFEKLEELRLLLRKFSSPQDAHKILEWANITLRQGDESFLNNKLEQLRMLDTQGW